MHNLTCFCVCNPTLAHPSAHPLLSALRTHRSTNRRPRRRAGTQSRERRRSSRPRARAPPAQRNSHWPGGHAAAADRARSRLCRSAAGTCRGPSPRRWRASPTVGRTASPTSPSGQSRGSQDSPRITARPTGGRCRWVILRAAVAAVAAAAGGARGKVSVAVSARRETIAMQRAAWSEEEARVGLGPRLGRWQRDRLRSRLARACFSGRRSTSIKPVDSK